MTTFNLNTRVALRRRESSGHGDAIWVRHHVFPKASASRCGLAFPGPEWTADVASVQGDVRGCSRCGTTAGQAAATSKEARDEPRWSAKEAREEGFAHAVSHHLQGILALPRPLAVEGEKVPYLKGIVQALRNSLEAAERALAEAEAAQDRAVSIREEYADPGAPPDYFNDQESLR